MELSLIKLTYQLVPPRIGSVKHKLGICTKMNKNILLLALLFSANSFAEDQTSSSDKITLPVMVIESATTLPLEPQKTIGSDVFGEEVITNELGDPFTEGSLQNDQENTNP